MIKSRRQGLDAKAGLSDAALVLLSEAANREDGIVLPAPASLRARGGALDKILTKLLRQGLVTEVRVRAAEQAWRSDEAESRIGLKITEAGLQAIGVPAAQERLGEEEQCGDQPPASPRRTGKAVRKPARVSVPTDAAAMAASAEAELEPPAAPAAKPGSKQALLIERLGRPAGARIADLVTALGWQPHTVRAALTRLRQQGHSINRSKDEQGETVYRLGAPEPKPEGAAAQPAA